MENRILSIREALKEGQAAIINSPSNRFYVTGFESSAGTVIITKNSAAFIIDFRYIEKAKTTVKHMNVVIQEALNNQINEIIDRENIEEVLIESETLSVEEFKKFEEALKAEVLNNSTLSDKLTSLRAIKTKTELENIKKAQEITDRTFEYILTKIKPGVTEREIALDMEFYSRKQGSECAAFDFIVVSGKNSSLPHGVPTDKKIENGDFITMDFGATVGGYRSDMTRTVAVGNVSEEQKKVYETVLQAQTSAIDASKPNVVCKDIDKVARDIIYAAGYEGCFGHGLGHSVGIDIHENPCFNMRDTSVTKKGIIMTVEPGIYLENKFGVRIEDMIYITEDGCENLTHSPKELIIL